MALNSSGPISLGGATTGQSINLELGQSATTQVSLNDTNVRALAGVTTSFSTIVVPLDFWGKSTNSYWIAAIPAVSNAVFMACVSVAQNGTDYIYSVTTRNSSDPITTYISRFFRIDGNTAAIQKQVQISPGNWVSKSIEHTDGYIYATGAKFASTSRGYASIIKLDSNFNLVASSQGTTRSGSTSTRYYYHFDIHPTTGNVYVGTDGYGTIVYDSNLNQISRETPTGGVEYIKFKNNNVYIAQNTPTYTQALYNISTQTTGANNSTTNSGNMLENCDPSFRIAGDFLIKCGHSGTAGGSLPCVIKQDGTTLAPSWGFQLTGFASGARFKSTSIDSDQNIYVFAVYNNLSNITDYAMAIFKLDPSGTVLWQRVITTTLGAYVKGINIDATQPDAMVINMFVGSAVYISYPVIMKLPNDGSKTGTYSINGGTVTYAASSYSYGTFSVPNTTQTITTFAQGTSVGVSNTQGSTSFSTTVTTL
jgi:hypothetical protein